MTGLPLKKRCKQDESLTGPSSSAILEAASALTALCGTPPASDDESDNSCVGNIVTTSGYASASSMSDASSSSVKSTDSSTFPEKLMEIVQTEDGSDSSEPAIAWLPSGDGFVISNAKKFILEVLPKYFTQQTEFSSFTRKLYWWGFKKTSRGLNCDSFQHEFFRRDDPKLCLKMRGRCSGGSRKRKSKQARRSQVKAKTLPKASQSSSGDQGDFHPAKCIPPQQQGPAPMDMSNILMRASLFTNLQLQAQATQQAKAYQMAIQQARAAKLICQPEQLSCLGGGINGLLPALQVPTARMAAAPAKASPRPQPVVIHVHHHHGQDGQEVATRVCHSPNFEAAY